MQSHCVAGTGAIMGGDTVADGRVFGQGCLPTRGIFEVAGELRKVWINTLIEEVADDFGDGVVAQTFGDCDVEGAVDGKTGLAGVLRCVHRVDDTVNTDDVRGGRCLGGLVGDSALKQCTGF